jgi:hypothetical protein
MINAYGGSQEAESGEPAKSFDDLWDESVHTFAHQVDPPPAVITPPADAAAESKEFDTSKFAKGSRAPPNTPTAAIHATAESASVGVSTEQRNKKNPIKHPRRTSASKSAKSDKKDKKKDNKEKKRDKDPSSEKNDQEEKSKDVEALEKQLDRVTFLQKRQFDQLSSLKKMLLLSRNKEKESVKATEEWKRKAEEKDSEISALEKKLDQAQSDLHLSKQKLKRAQATGAPAASAAIGTVDDKKAAKMEAELVEKDAKIAHLEERLEAMERKKQEEIEAKEFEAAAELKINQDKIAELEKRLQDTENGHKEATEQLQNSVEILENKLKKKTEQEAKTLEEMEELRKELTTANASIEQLEEERNFSRAKMSELNDIVSSKGGISDAEKELLDRAAEISNLKAKLNATHGKEQERDSKIHKLEEELNSISELVKQLSDAFAADDEELKKNQALLLESASSPSQSSSLLLMTMMNTLDAMKTKMVTLQKERDDMNAKAADRGIQLAESHIRVDKLRTELRRMRAERDRAGAGRGGRGPAGRGQGGRTPAGQSPAAQGQGGRGQPPTPNGSQTSNGQARPNQNGAWASANAKTMNNQSEQDKLAVSTRTAPPTPSANDAKPNRFMNFFRGNLTQEAVGPEPEKDPAVVVRT